MIRVLKTLALLFFRALPVYVFVWFSMHMVAPVLLLHARTRHGRRLALLFCFADLCWATLAGYLFFRHSLLNERDITEGPLAWLPLALGFLAMSATLIGPRFLWPDDLSKEWRKPPVDFVLGYFPEHDLIRVVVRLIGFFDRRIPRVLVRRMIDRTEQLLQSEEKGDRVGTPALGMPIAVEGLAGLTLLPNALQHGYVTGVAQHTKKEKPPALIFLHGHGGNHQLHLLALAGFPAHVLLPSFSYGNWESPAGVEIIRRELDYALHELKADPQRIYLAGISQGGAGVSRAGAILSDRIAGLVYYSPTMEMPVIQSPAFTEGWKGRPVLVFQGGRDNNVKPRTVDAAVDAMKAAGVDVTYIFDPDEDHFYFFGAMEFVHRRTCDWMQMVESKRRSTREAKPQRTGKV